MDNLKKLTGQVSLRLAALVLAGQLLLAGLWWIGTYYAYLPQPVLLAVLLAAACISAWLFGAMGARMSMTPVKQLQQAILHVAPNHLSIGAPNLSDVRLGRDLVTSLALEVYELASSAGKQDNRTAVPHNKAAGLAGSMPLPVITIDANKTITYANQPAAELLGVPAKDMTGINAYSLLDLSFHTPRTFDAWLGECLSGKVTDTSSWGQVRLRTPAKEGTLQVDMAARFTKSASGGAEVVIVLFDQSEKYNQDDQEISFVAAAVHELRTPLTLLRGYIEVFEEELGDKLDPELADFMHKMQASAKRLSVFANNVLNVARIEADQLNLRLQEATWGDLVKNVVEDYTLEASVNHKQLQYSVAENLPSVAVDSVSIYEVLGNLISNAIKYSGDSQKTITISAYLTKDGLVETTVQDNGAGIPATVVQHLFQRFYRNHRTRDTVGGSGLGLYLAKAIVEAHGGSIWVKSKEGEGSTFGFTVQPYAALAEQLKNTDTKGIVRGVHGWIKNHSMYRR